jgi:hypothetical protein
MAGKAQPPRVRYTLAVAEHHIRQFLKTLKRLEKQGDFAKGKEPRHVRVGSLGSILY